MLVAVNYNHRRKFKICLLPRARLFDDFYKENQLNLKCIRGAPGVKTDIQMIHSFISQRGENHRFAFYKLWIKWARNSFSLCLCYVPLFFGFDMEFWNPIPLIKHFLSIYLLLTIIVLHWYLYEYPVNLHTLNLLNIHFCSFSVHVTFLCGRESTVWCYNGNLPAGLAYKPLTLLITSLSIIKNISPEWFELYSRDWFFWSPCHRFTRGRSSFALQMPVWNENGVAFRSHMSKSNDSIQLFTSQPASVGKWCFLNQTLKEDSFQQPFEIHAWHLKYVNTLLIFCTSNFFHMYPSKPIASAVCLYILCLPNDFEKTCNYNAE